MLCYFCCSKKSKDDRDNFFESITFQISEEDFNHAPLSPSGEEEERDSFRATPEMFNSVVAHPMLCKRFAVGYQFKWVLEIDIFEKLIYIIFEVSEYFRMEEDGKGGGAKFLVLFDNVPTQIVIHDVYVEIYLYHEADSETFQKIREVAASLERGVKVFCFSQDVGLGRGNTNRTEKSINENATSNLLLKQMDALLQLTSQCVQRLDGVERRLTNLEKKY